MKFKTLLMVAALMGLCACGQKSSGEAAQEETDVQEECTLSGRWCLAEYASADSLVQVDPEAEYCLVFDASNKTFGATTDCNSIGGEFCQSADSLTFSNIACTQMACPDMTIETALNALLPQVRTFKVECPAQQECESPVLVLCGAEDAVLAKFVKMSGCSHGCTDCDGQCNGNCQGSKSQEE